MSISVTYESGVCSPYIDSIWTPAGITIVVVVVVDGGGDGGGCCIGDHGLLYAHVQSIRVLDHWNALCNHAGLQGRPRKVNGVRIAEEFVGGACEARQSTIRSLLVHIMSDNGERISF